MSTMYTYVHVGKPKVGKRPLLFGSFHCPNRRLLKSGKRVKITCSLIEMFVGQHGVGIAINATDP